MEREARLRGVATLLCGCAVLTLLAVALIGDQGVRHHEVLRRQMAELAERKAQAQQENARLEEEKRALRQSPDYVEWVIRQELGWIRPGERVLRLTP